MQRRSFLAASSALLASGFVPADEVKPRRKVAVIGHTGRGNFGHGLDTVWLKLPETEILAVSDGNPEGLAKQKKILKIDRGYTDYRQMLQEVQPEFVSVCPRHMDQHHDMSMAAIEAGVKGLYVEKPFCRTPAEADSLLAAAEKSGAKIAVAHRNRYHPALKQIDALIESGQLGKLLQIRGRGKGDRRGGDEDAWVLGTHVFNLFEYFAGSITSCSAVMLKDGQHVTAKDIKPGAEGLGLLAANEVHARYETTSGVFAYYDSIANDGTAGNAYCLQLIGSKGTVTLHIDRRPVAHFTAGNPYDPANSPRTWQPITTSGVGEPEPRSELVEEVYNHVVAVRDLIDACDNNRPPLCNGHAAAATVEMTCAIFESHRLGGKTVDLPLRQRQHPLELMLSEK